MENKLMKILGLILSLMLISCNQKAVLEMEVEDLKSDVKRLEKNVEELEEYVEELEYKNEKLKNTISEMYDDIQMIRYYANSASGHASSAAFWLKSESGSDFLYQSEIRNMVSDIEAIINIANSY